MQLFAVAARTVKFGCDTLSKGERARLNRPSTRNEDHLSAGASIPSESASTRVGPAWANDRLVATDRYGTP